MRVRGLKRVGKSTGGRGGMSHPMRVRGLKLTQFVVKGGTDESHPMRVRGLKPPVVVSLSAHVVAPHAGAWIETLPKSLRQLNFMSHPMRVRGLKHIPL